MLFKNIFAILYTFCIAAWAQGFENQWENIKYHKTIDVVKSYVKERHDIKTKNIASEPVDEYIVGFPKYLASDITLVLALTTSIKSGKSLLNSKVFEFENQNHNITYYKIKLPYPIAPNSEFDLTISALITNQLFPVPEFAPMGALQTLTLKTNRYPLSPYSTSGYTLAFIGVKDYVETVTNEKTPYIAQTESQNDRVLFSIEETIVPESYSDLELSFTRNAPLPYVNYLKRDFWVSHWSNALQLEEYYEITNKGVKLDKGFSRADWLNGQYTLKPNAVISSLQIPFDSEHEVDSVYFVDKVGNVSTSQFFDNELILKPRYPIFGGWNYNFTLGWNFKLNEFLKQKNDDYVLNVRVLDGLHDATYENVDFSIYLPEGAELIDVALPFHSSEPKISQEMSYLDYSTGHTKIQFHFENLVDEMKNLEAVVYYRFTTFSMLEKPIYCAFYIFLALFGFYILKKIDLSIRPMSRNIKENQGEL